MKASETNSAVKGAISNAWPKIAATWSSVGRRATAVTVLVMVGLAVAMSPAATAATEIDQAIMTDPAAMIARAMEIVPATAGQTAKNVLAILPAMTGRTTIAVPVGSVCLGRVMSQRERGLPAATCPAETSQAATIFLAASKTIVALLQELGPMARRETIEARVGPATLVTPLVRTLAHRAPIGQCDQIAPLVRTWLDPKSLDLMLQDPTLRDPAPADRTLHLVLVPALARCLTLVHRA